MEDPYGDSQHVKQIQVELQCLEIEWVPEPHLHGTPQSPGRLAGQVENHPVHSSHTCAQMRPREKGPAIPGFC